MKKTFLIIVCILGMFFMTGCFAQKDASGEREAFMQAAEGDVVIGLPGPVTYMKDITGFYNGVMMAVDEINSTGGLKGRYVKVRLGDDKGAFSDGMKIAREFAMQEDVVAVIGHWNSYITLPAARIYNDAGLVMLSPVVSNSGLTEKGYKYVFQNTINDNEMGRQMAAYAAEKGYERIVVFYADNDYGRGLANAFEDSLADKGGMVVDRMTELANTTEFNKAYERWKAFGYDAFFIADSMPHAGDFIKMLREKDTGVPIFAGDGLDIADLPSMLGKASEGIVVATMYNEEGTDDRQKEFADTYREKFKSDPDVWAVQGYDSVKLLYQAMQKAKTPVPSEIASVLHSEKGWKGVSGTAEFDENGVMTGKSIYKKIIVNGRMEYLKN